MGTRTCIPSQDSDGVKYEITAPSPLREPQENWRLREQLELTNAKR